MNTQQLKPQEGTLIDRQSCLPTYRAGMPGHWLVFPAVVLIRWTGAGWIIEAKNGDGRQATYTGPLPRNTGEHVRLTGRRGVGATIWFDIAKLNLTVDDYEELQNRI